MLLPFHLPRLVPIVFLAFAALFVLTHNGIYRRPPQAHLPPFFGQQQQPLPPIPPGAPSQPAEQVGTGGEQQPSGDGATCPSDIERLRNTDLGLSQNILYTRRCIKPVWGAKAQRDNVTMMPGHLFDRQTPVNLSSCELALDDSFRSCEPIVLDVPVLAPQKKYPHLVFGVATNYDRLQEGVATFAHWLSGTDALMVAVVMDALAEDGDGDGPGKTDKEMRAMEDLYRQFGMELRCVVPRRPKLTVDKNHFTMLEDMVEAAGPDTRWLGVLDDDTFFPSMHNLDAELSKHDHTRSVWLGAMSEDLGALKLWGVMAFGGAGIFISMPLAHELVPKIDQCLQDTPSKTGDCILRDCVFTETHTKLTIVPGLYQHDINGDVSGFYESGVRPLSVHHWKSWYHEPMNKMASVTHLCGDCFLQRWQFGEDTLLANGYSITRYLRDGGLSGVDLSRVENTWNGQPGDFDWSIGPIRSRLPDGQKKSYKLREVLTTPDGEFRQVYVHYGSAEKQEVDEVIELVWKV